MVGGTSFLLAASLIASTSASPLAIRQASNSTETFFQNLPLSKELNYVPCFQNFTCTKLEVLLDYEDSEPGTTHIALMRWNTPKQPAMGDIIFNPGGPGISAIDDLIVLLEPLRNLLGERYNIVALEPRGIKYSGPNVNCFQGRPEVEAAYFSSLSGLTFSNKVQRAKTYEAYGAAGAWCSHTVNSTANYVNTPAVARDMLHYSELLAKSQGKPCNESKADYYGASYGTALGTTFAQMFPDRVGHFVLDAVVDMEDYYFGNWSQNLLQADQAVEGFFKDCADAGPACALYRNGSTAGSIKKRFDSLLQRLSNSPMWTADPTLVNFPVVVDDAPIRLALRDALYNPPITFAPLAERLAQLEKGNVTSFASTSQAPPASGADIWGSIFYKCTDNNKRYKGTMKALEDLLVLSKEISSYFGEMWAPSSVLACRTLKFSPPPSQRFDNLKKVKTSTPILFADNTIDPVTSSYYKMTKFFEGSEVLLQKAMGHGLVVARSNCTEDYVQTYLESGKLPPPGTLCDTDFQSFPKKK